MDAPNAACKAYDLDKDPEAVLRELVVAVVDIGAESLRVSIINVDDGVFEALGESHNRTLGGDSYNREILEWLVGTDDPGRLIGRYLEETERIKYAMSQPSSITKFEGHEARMLRDAFDKLTRGLVNESITFLDRALESAGVNETGVDRLMITGGSSKIPQVRAKIESYFGRKSMVLRYGEPDEAAARGAAMVGAMISEESASGDQLCSMSFLMVPVGIESSGGTYQEIIPRTELVPARRSMEFYISKHQPLDQPVEIRAFAGMRKLVRYNMLLGELVIPQMDPGLNFTITMYWNEDDSRGLIVHNSSG
ncbi:ATPase with role in protein import into the ER, partial [Ceratobasidium sp. 392]